MTNTFTTKSSEQTIKLGALIGARLAGGEVVELISDLGGGKTTFVRGLADGLGSNEPVASPSFAISFVYSAGGGKHLHHYDFYRLSEPGIMKNELLETLNDKTSVVIIEWGDIVKDFLPDDSIKVTIKKVSETEREFIFDYDDKYSYLFNNQELNI